MIIGQGTWEIEDEWTDLGVETRRITIKVSDVRGSQHTIQIHSDSKQPEVEEANRAKW
jgi:hypothetical protein